MRKTRLLQNTRLLSAQAYVLNGFFERGKGLLGKSTLGPYEAYIFPHCTKVHTFGMKIPLEIVYLDDKRRLIASERLLPGRFGHPPQHAAHLIELSAANSIRLHLCPGQSLHW